MRKLKQQREEEVMFVAQAYASALAQAPAVPQPTGQPPSFPLTPNIIVTNSDNEMPLRPQCESTPNRPERADIVGSCGVSGIELVKEVHEVAPFPE